MVAQVALITTKLQSIFPSTEQKFVGMLNDDFWTKNLLKGDVYCPLQLPKGIIWGTDFHCTKAQTLASC